MPMKELPKGAYHKGKRGPVIFKNDLGTLEGQSVKQGSGTFIGSCFVGNVEHTRRMSGEKNEVRERWENWQRQTIKTEKDRKERAMAQKVQASQDVKLLEAVASIASELKAINETLAEIGLAIMEESPAQAEKPKAMSDGVAEFVASKDWTDFVNLQAKQVYEQYKATNPAIVASQRTLTKAVKEAFADRLVSVVVGGQTRFAARK